MIWMGKCFCRLQFNSRTQSLLVQKNGVEQHSKLERDLEQDCGCTSQFATVKHKWKFQHKVANLCVARWTAAETIRYFRDVRELASAAPPGSTTHYLHRVHCPEDLHHRPLVQDDQADMDEAMSMGMGFSLDEA